MSAGSLASSTARTASQGDLQTPSIEMEAAKSASESEEPVVNPASVPLTTIPRPLRRKPRNVPSSGDAPGFWDAFMVACSWIFVVITFPFSLCVCFKVVQQYQRAVILRLGRKLPGGPKGPGLFFVLPCIDQYTKVDLRTVTFDIQPQEILSRDSVTVAVDAVVYFKISDPTASIMNVWDAGYSTKLLAQTTLRNTLGMRTLAEVLSERESIASTMQGVLDEATDVWGIKVERVEVKNVVLPKNLQRAMAAEAEATREAKAKFIAADGEHKASQALRRAGEVIMESPTALQLRYLQTLSTVSAEKNSTIIFPVPIDMFPMSNK